MAYTDRSIDPDFAPVVAQSLLNVAGNYSLEEWVELHHIVNLPRLSAMVNADYEAWVSEKAAIQAAIQAAKEELS